MAREYKDVVVGLDIGTAKIMAVVAEVLPGGELKLAGLGVAPSNGLKRGVVVNIDATVQSIQQALKEAELMADCKIQRVYTGITGSHIRGLNSSGMVAVKDKEVTAADVARVIETAKAINISTDQRLLLVEDVSARREAEAFSLVARRRLDGLMAGDRCGDFELDHQGVRGNAHGDAERGQACWGS